jgi:hypothetical protein
MIMFLSVPHDYILPHFTKRVYCSGSTIPQENTSLIAKTYLTRFSNDMALWPVLICCGITVMYYILKRIHSKYHCWGNIKISISHCEHLMKGKCICLSHKWTFIAVSTIICFILKWNGCMYKYTIKRPTLVDNLTVVSVSVTLSWCSRNIYLCNWQFLNNVIYYN